MPHACALVADRVRSGPIAPNTPYCEVTSLRRCSSLCFNSSQRMTVPAHKSGWVDVRDTASGAGSDVRDTASGGGGDVRDTAS
eukprot:4866266-Pleurochrysis_carterae.AAC.1